MSPTLVRHERIYQEIRALYLLSFMDLVLKTQAFQRENFPTNTVQASTLFKHKVNGCPKDCHWCGQSV